MGPGWTGVPPLQHVWWRTRGGRFGYGLAWIGHVAVERNAPATFTDPPRSFVCDLRMLLLTVAGRMDEEFARQGIAQLGPGAARSSLRHRTIARLERAVGMPERPDFAARSLPARLAAALRHDDP